MSTERNGLKRKSAMAGLLAILLSSGLLLSSVWADDGFYQDGNIQRVYSSQGGAYPQYFPRIDPEAPSPYQAQYNYPPLKASTSASRQNKPLSSKIAGGVSDLWKSPSVKSGIAGAGIGLGTAALTKHVGLWHGTWLGAAYGVGFGMMDEMNFFKRHPLMRKTAKGAVVGLGAAAVSGAAALGPAAAVGAGVGAGIHLLNAH